jgi:hypothetical protein
MDGGMMLGPDISLTLEIEALVQRIGRLPEAPLAMPKQRLEELRKGLVGGLVGARPDANDLRRIARARGTE